MVMPSYALPRSVDDDGAGDTDIDLGRILAAAGSILRDADTLRSDKSPDRKMTQQRAKTLSNIRSFKNESSLTSYFQITKQLLAYTREGENLVVSQDMVETTSLQRQAMEDAISALRRRDKAAKGSGALVNTSTRR
ncbi:telomere-associated recq helicase [Fusarium bulbicola]|nr:telomere-associated recq helicase [Fusarium bulbicola]